MRHAPWAVVIPVLVVCLTCSGCGLLIGKALKLKDTFQPSSTHQTTSSDSSSSSKDTTETIAHHPEASSPESVAPTGPAGESGEKTEPAIIRGTLPQPARGETRTVYVPVGAQRTLTRSDLGGLSQWQLDILRNEIYAAHGRPFRRSDLRSYFSGKSWYREDGAYSESRLSALEKRNAAFIADYQQGRSTARNGSSSDSRPGRSFGADGQMLYWSSARRVTAADLVGLNSWQLDVARNEVYARHGRIFKRDDLRNYFNSLPWYHPDASYSDGRLSAIERRNAEFMRTYQGLR
jgi:hypothetical protein